MPAGEAEFARLPVTGERLGRLMTGAVNLDDRTLGGAEAEAALDALAEEHEGADRVPAVVALAGRGSRATPAALAGLSRASGVAIVRGVDGSPDSEVPQATDGRDDPAVLRERFAAALRSERHPAGVVGAVPLPGADRGTGRGAGASGDPAALLAETARIEVAAGAAREAGVALVLSPSGDPWSVNLEDEPGRSSLRRAFDAVDAAGLDRSRVILTGAAACVAARDEAGRPLTGLDPSRLDALLAHGTAVCFDGLGRIPTVRTVESDHDVALAILACAERGASGRVLLSTGIRNKHRLTAFGGNGLEFVSQQFLPYLRTLGADDALIDAVGGGNAARVLARDEEGAAHRDS